MLPPGESSSARVHEGARKPLLVACGLGSRSCCGGSSTGADLSALARGGVARVRCRGARGLAGPARGTCDARGCHAEISAPMLGVVAAMFGLLLAFVIIIAYRTFSRQAPTSAGKQTPFPRSCATARRSREPEGDRVRDAVEPMCARLSMSNGELMREGSDSPRATRALDGVFDALQTVEPRSPDATVCSTTRCAS